MGVMEIGLGKMISKYGKKIALAVIAIAGIIGEFFIPNYYIEYLIYVLLILFLPLLIWDLIDIRKEDKANGTTKFWMSLLTVSVTIAIMAVLISTCIKS